MCFSASASFAASAVLSVIGILSLIRVQNSKEYLFASIPLLFAIQQLAEGLVWLSFPYPGAQFLYSLGIYTFLFFAMIIWPMWIPFSVQAMEPQENKRMQISFCFLSGVIFATQLFLWLIKHGASVSIHNHHILYVLELPKNFIVVGTLLYLIAIALPFFISSYKRMWIIGIAFTTSYFLSYIYFTKTLLSIWCFFAALLSLLIPSILI